MMTASLDRLLNLVQKCCGKVGAESDWCSQDAEGIHNQVEAFKRMQ
jgi:hypothetical protein